MDLGLSLDINRMMRTGIGGVGLSLRAQLVSALFDSSEQGAVYERAGSPATLEDQSGNDITATWNGAAYAATFPDLGADASIFYVADDDGVTKSINQAISGATVLPENGWVALLVYESALTAEEETRVRDWLWGKFDSGVTGRALLADDVALNTTGSGLLTVR